MDKQSSIIGLSIVLNRGLKTEQETACFENVTHDILVEGIKEYLLLHANLLGDMHIETSQALNDHGVDLILTSNQVCKIGIQVKSHFDVSEKDFATKVKRQYAESLAHGLDKWYLLICAPMKSGKNDFSGKINHLINELSMFKTKYHCVFGPQYTAEIYKNFQPMSIDEFNYSLQKYSYAQTDIEAIKELIKNNLNSSPKENRDNFSYNVDPYKAIAPQSCNGINKVLDWGNSEEELKCAKKDFIVLLNVLQKIPLNTRKFLSMAIEKAVLKGDNLHALIFEIRNSCNISEKEFSDHAKLLEKYRLMELDGDDYDYIFINNGSIRWPIMKDLIVFAERQHIPIDQIIVCLNFGFLDKIQ